MFALALPSPASIDEGPDPAHIHDPRVVRRRGEVMTTLVRAIR